MALGPGLVLKAVCARVSRRPPQTSSARSLLAVLAAVEVGRGLETWSAMVAWPRWWHTVSAWIRANLLGAVLCGSGPPFARLPGSPGEAGGRFRDDVDDIVWLADILGYVAGAIVLGGVRIAVMLSI